MLGVPKHFMEAKKERSLSRFIPYSCVVTPHTIKTREGDYLRTWKLSGVPFETVDPVDLAVWKDNLNTLFRSIGSEKISLYVHQVRRQTFDRLPATFQNSFCRQLDENYYHSFGAYRMLRNELYFTLVYRPNSGVQRRLLRVARTLEDIKRAQEKALQSLNEISSQVESGLSRYKPKLLGNRTEQGITFSEPLELLNFLISGSWQPVRLPGAPLYEYLGTSQVIVGTETIELRGVSSSRYLRMLDLKDYPTETEPGIFDGLLYAKVEYVLTQSFSFVSTATGKAALIRQRNQLSGADEGSSSQVQQMNEAIDSLTSGDFAVGEYHFSLAVFGEDLEQLRNDTTELQVMLQNAGFLPALVTTALDAAFFSQLPANWAYRTRPATLTTRNFASFAGFHNFKQGKRNKNPWGDAVTLLQTPSGAPYYYNFHTAVEGEDSFDQKVLGNTLVLGQSGAGKTVLLTFLLCQVQKFAANSPLGFTSFFFDKDRGAELAVRALGGKYLALETGQPSGLNPFQLEPTNENLQFLEQLIEVLVCGDGHKLSPADKQRISEAVRTVMRFPREIRRLGLVPQNMTEGSNREGSVVQRLARWCSGGALAWVFDNETDSLDFTSHQNYGIDGTSFLDNAAVRTPISLYLLHRMEQVIDGRRFLFFMDEFWKWVGDSAFSDFVFNKLKTIRKQNGFGVFATQSPSDVLSSDIARAIVEQCATGIYLPNPRADKKEYVEGFGLTEAEFGLLCELGESSRLFLVKQGKTSALAGLQLKGFDRELAILSGSTDNIALFQEIKQEVGENPDEWMPPFFERLAARKRAPKTVHKQP